MANPNIATFKLVKTKCSVVCKGAGWSQQGVPGCKTVTTITFLIL